ncbi:SDR family oxidoreductase [Pusillimonas caeni]|uniref:SDR family oxidoreductase n=1 Tax=Pusillimonas caeni TaxID=1348472 RepID=UPI000E59CD21|nr:SDR family oxidoreductase [Pusillimonas caeni]TFL14689.1 SDR family oxidoreductase [Pusillimonas caeni]
MNYDITGKKAIVCAASRGLGKGCAMALAHAGVDLVINGRDPDVLAATAEEIRSACGVKVQAVAGDITTEAGRARVLAACPSPDILVTNAGGPPPGDFRSWERQQWMDALDANMLTPIELIKATLDGMIQRRFGRIVNITSSGVKEPIAVLGLSNGARTGLTGFVAGLSRDTIRHNVTINNLLPGAFDTDRRAAIVAAGAKASGRSEQEVRREQISQTPAGRFGTIEEFGAACAFLCSAQAGFITGQNLLLDGGAYQGTMG